MRDETEIFLKVEVYHVDACGSPSPPLKVLTTDPERMLALARVTLG